MDLETFQVFFASRPTDENLKARLASARYANLNFYTTFFKNVAISNLVDITYAQRDTYLSCRYFALATLSPP